jgi:glycosyltransferase involved in cell wall biosynthesis
LDECGCPPHDGKTVRILNIFNHYLERGGEAHAVEAMGESLAQISDLERCEFFSADWTGPTAPAKWKQALWMIRNPESLRKLRACERSFKSDVWLVHNVLPVGSVAIYSEAKRLGIPAIQYVHNFRPFSVNGYLWAGGHMAPGGLSKNYWEEVRTGAWQNSRGKTAWLAFVLLLTHALGWWRGVKAWIAISDFMRQKFISAGVPAEKIFTLRHFWKPRSEEYANCGQHYLFLGRLAEAKGVNVLLDTWKILEHKHGSSTPKLLIGGDGPLRSAVVARAERMESVTYAGQLSGAAKTEALSKARAVVVPSIWWEPLGLVVYEAYDYSRPVLAARSGGLPEIVIHSETGLLHDPGNATQLAEQVMELEGSTQRWKELGRQGKAWLQANANESDWHRRFCEIAQYAMKSSTPH